VVKLEISVNHFWTEDTGSQQCYYPYTVWS